ncbi:hypothetical protein DMN91_003762 [Ooceraea biroi]|uniref:THAP-type domain-containing protein n=1 Tax=Ooceraea biroi TaxID=2015173 RepID=A0A3L8DT03_OOCBI|nr:hypothetical protein DMN91_003762 [Ooceraea biroi]
MPQCIIKQCKNRTVSRPVLERLNEERNLNISYHRFPKKEKIRQLWLDILELSAESVPVGGRICSAHFSEDAFDLSTGTRRLRPNTLPYKGIIYCFLILVYI